MFLDAPSVERLIEAFRRLPGVGKRSAERFALHLLTAREEDAYALSDAIREARDRITTCSVCCNLTETDPCAICTSHRRDRSIVCVVERPAAVIAIEKGGAYRGLYHVLQRVRAAIAHRVGVRLRRFLEGVYRHHGPQGVFARSWPTGSTVMWVALLLGALLIVYYIG